MRKRILRKRVDDMKFQEFKGSGFWNEMGIFFQPNIFADDLNGRIHKSYFIRAWVGEKLTLCNIISMDSPTCFC